MGIRVVKAFVRAGYEKTKFKKSNDDLTKAAINVGYVGHRHDAHHDDRPQRRHRRRALPGRLHCDVRRMLIGDLSSFITYIFQILMSVMMLGMSLQASPAPLPAPAGSTRCWRPSPPLRTALRRRHAACAHGPGGIPPCGLQVVRPGHRGECSHRHRLHRPPRRVPLLWWAVPCTGKSSLVNPDPRFYDRHRRRCPVDGWTCGTIPWTSSARASAWVLRTTSLHGHHPRESAVGRPDATGGGVR